MKIAVYAIALNEEGQVPAFVETCRDADLIVVGDTGSTDKTAMMLERCGVRVYPIHVQPWRFDVARNAVLSLLPDDIDLCIALDFDERLATGWRDAIQKAWNYDIDQLEFRYVHSFTSPGVPGIVGTKDFIHTRFGFIWRHIVHESLDWVGEQHPLVQRRFVPDLVIEHHQNYQAARGNYVRLLEREVQEHPTEQHYFWLAREYMQLDRWRDAVPVIAQHLDMARWPAERATSMILMGDAHVKQGCPESALICYLGACREWSNQREPWLALARFYMSQDQAAQAYGVLCQALSIVQRDESYLTRDESWSHEPHELAACCARRLGLHAAEHEHQKRSLELKAATTAVNEDRECPTSESSS